MSDCPKRTTKILTGQYGKAVRANHPHLIPIVDASDVRVWYVLVVGLPAPYLGGEFLFRLEAKNEFPQKAPNLKILTPSGVYTPDENICISVGEYHENDAPGETGSHGWRPCLGMLGFAQEAMNGLICTDTLRSGLGICIKGPADRARLAWESHAANRARHPQLSQAIDEYANANPKHLAVRALRRWRATVRLASNATSPGWGLINAEAPAAFGDNWEVAAPAFLQAESDGFAWTPSLWERMLEALRAHDPRAQKALLAALTSRLAPPDSRAAARALETLPEAVAEALGARADGVAGRLRRLSAEAPQRFPKYHTALSKLLLEDKPEARGDQLAALASALAGDLGPAPAPAPAPALAPTPAPASTEKLPIAYPETPEQPDRPSDADEISDYLAELGLA